MGFLLWLVAASLAQPVIVEGPPPAPPAEDKLFNRKAETFTEDVCPTKNTAQFKMHRGFGEGQSELEARRAAEEDARRKARTSLCGGDVDSLGCAARMQLTATEGPGQAIKVRKNQWKACQTLAADWDRIQDLPSVGLRGSTSAVAEGGGVDLFWNTHAVSSCTLNGDAVGEQGGRSEWPASDTLFELRCTAEDGSVLSASHRVRVGSPPTIERFEPVQPVTRPGDPLQFTYVASPDARCQVEVGSTWWRQSGPVVEVRQYMLGENRARLRCENDFGEVTADTTARVLALGGEPLFPQECECRTFLPCWSPVQEREENRCETGAAVYRPCDNVCAVNRDCRSAGIFTPVNRMQAWHCTP